MPFCEGCGEVCTVKVIDEGIGSYEFWGARGCQVLLVPVSDCCEAPCYEERGEDGELTGPIEELPDYAE